VKNEARDLFISFFWFYLFPCFYVFFQLSLLRLRIPLSKKQQKQQKAKNNKIRTCSTKSSVEQHTNPVLQDKQFLKWSHHPFRTLCF